MLLRFGLALVAGFALTLAFAPFNVTPLAFISPLVLLLLLLPATAKQATLTAFIYGFGFFITSCYWVYISIYVYGNAPLFIALLATFLFAVILASLFFATFGFACHWLMKKTTNYWACIAVFPATWVLWEGLRTVLFTGFPWVLLGYSQMASPLKAYAPIFGVYGVTFLTLVISGTLASFTFETKKFSKFLSVIIFIAIFAVAFGLQGKSWTVKDKDPISVSLVQGNIEQSLKWNSAQLIHNLQVYKDLTATEWQQQQLIIWPEAAVPALPQQLPEFIESLKQQAKQNNSTLIFGIPLYDPKTAEYFNGLLMVGAHEGSYKKQHLVPFGEYLPLKFLFSWFYKYFDIPMSDFSEGTDNQPPLVINNIKIAPFICYEIIYPWQVLREAIHKQILLTISDDSWFGNSIALNQHLQMAQMRALETGRYLLLVTNTGITAIIDPQGAVIQKLSEDQAGVLKGKIWPMRGKTPLMIWQYYLVFLLTIFLIVVSLKIYIPRH